MGWRENTITPTNAIIADSNPELINLYDSIARDVEEVIKYLTRLINTPEIFYALRALD